MLSPSAFGEGNRLFAEFKGALTKNYIPQALQPQFEVPARYWSQANPVDFLVQYENEIIPIEVKAETNTEARGLKKHKEKYVDQTCRRIRKAMNTI